MGPRVARRGGCCVIMERRAGREGEEDELRWVWSRDDSAFAEDRGECA